MDLEIAVCNHTNIDLDLVFQKFNDNKPKEVNLNSNFSSIANCQIKSLAAVESNTGFENVCFDDLSVTDSTGDTCANYDTYPSFCGNYDTETFTASTACCVCKGEVNGEIN